MRSVTYGFRRRDPGHRRAMFFFFSNRLGCAGSILLSVAITVLLILLLNR